MWGEHPVRVDDDSGYVITGTERPPVEEESCHTYCFGLDCSRSCSCGSRLSRAASR